MDKYQFLGQFSLKICSYKAFYSISLKINIFYSTFAAYVVLHFLVEIIYLVVHISSFNKTIGIIDQWIVASCF